MSEPIRREQAKAHVMNELARILRGQVAYQYRDEDRLDEDVVDCLVEMWKVEEEVARSPGNYGALLPFRYVIRDDDLKLVDTVLSSIGAAAGAGFFRSFFGATEKELLVGAVGIATSLMRLSHNLRLSTRLDAEDWAIVALLKASNVEGLSAKQLRKALRPSFPPLKKDNLIRRLEGLTKRAALNGEPIELIWKDHKGNWRTRGV